MRKISIISFLLFSFLFFFTEKALAEEPNPQSALGVAPAIIEVVLDPGEIKETAVSVFNITNFPLPVKGSIKAFFNDDPLINSEDKLKKTFDASSWFKLEPADFILQPREKREIKIMIDPAVDAEPGGHYATIYFQPLLSVDVLSPQTAYLTARVGVLSFLIVKGDINEKGDFGELKIKKFQQFGPINFKISFQNQGNIHLTPSGEIKIKNWRGREIAKINLNQKTILPQTIRELEGAWQKKYLLGKFTAQITILFGTESQKIEREITFWVVPWLPLLLLIILLTVIVIFSILVRRRVGLALRVLFGKAKMGELVTYKLIQEKQKEKRERR